MLARHIKRTFLPISLIRGFIPSTDFDVLKKTIHSLTTCTRVLQYGIYALQKMFRYGIWKSRNEIYQAWVISAHGCSYRSYCKDRRKNARKVSYRSTVNNRDAHTRVINDRFNDAPSFDQGPKRDYKGRIILNKEDKWEWTNTISSRVVKNIIEGIKTNI